MSDGALATKWKTCESANYATRLPRLSVGIYLVLSANMRTVPMLGADHADVRPLSIIGHVPLNAGAEIMINLVCLTAASSQS